MNIRVIDIGVADAHRQATGVFCRVNARFSISKYDGFAREASKAFVTQMNRSGTGFGLATEYPSPMTSK